MTREADQYSEKTPATNPLHRANQPDMTTGKTCETVKTQINPDGKLSRAEKTECIRLMSRLPRHQLQTLLEELIASSSSRKDTGSQPSKLTQRETEVLVLVANSYTRSEIASALGISPNTAARHIANIYRKLGISSVAEATNYAISARLTLSDVNKLSVS